jgi:hypothetical protein
VSAAAPGPSPAYGPGLARLRRGQNANSGSHAKPHAPQGLGSRRPQRGQNAKSGEASEPQPAQIGISPHVGLRVIAFARAGLLGSPRLWTAVAILLPVAWVGVWIGHRIHVRLAPALMARITGAVLLVVGVTLIVRTFR